MTEKEAMQIINDMREEPDHKAMWDQIYHAATLIAQVTTQQVMARKLGSSSVPHILAAALEIIMLSKKQHGIEPDDLETSMLSHHRKAGIRHSINQLNEAESKTQDIDITKL